MDQSPNHHITTSNFAGLRVAAFESRMGAEMASLIRRYGGESLVAPSMREIPLENNTEALAFGEELLAGRVDVLVLLTGVGTRALVDVLKTRHSLETIKAALRQVSLVARGPKPIAALRQFGLTAEIAVPEPNTWRDLLQALDANRSLSGVRVGVQEYGVSNTELLEGLRERGAQLTRVPVYRWALPEDLSPLRHVLREIVSDHVDVILITNAAQIEHVMQVLAEDQQADRFRQAVARMVVASIGPIASERLRSYDLTVDLEPSHPKMGILVKEASEQASSLLSSKR